MEKKTVILVTHQIQFIKAVENIIIMDKGKIVAQGGFEELNVNQHLYFYFKCEMGFNSKSVNRSKN